MKTFKSVAVVAGALCLLSTAASAAFINQAPQTPSFNQFSSGYREPAQLLPKDVQQLQQALADQGFYNGRIDGVWGARTSDAIKNYQRSTGSTVTGNVNSTMLDDLGVNIDQKTRDDMMQSEATIRRNERSNEH